VFDPGQGLPMFDGADLRAFIAQATWVTVNDYEAKMLSDRTGLSLAELSTGHLQGVIVTLGEQGCEVWEQGRRTHVPGVAATEVLDPTGCGDAFRGALLYGLEQGWPLVRCVGAGRLSARHALQAEVFSTSASQRTATSGETLPIRTSGVGGDQRGQPGARRLMRHGDRHLLASARLAAQHLDVPLANAQRLCQPGDERLVRAPVDRRRGQAHAQRAVVQAIDFGALRVGHHAQLKQHTGAARGQAGQRIRWGLCHLAHSFIAMPWHATGPRRCR